MPVKASYLAIIAAGGIVAWSAIKGKGISSVTRDILSGKNPSTATSANPITEGSVTAASGYGSYASQVSTAIQGSGPCSAATIEANLALGKILAATYGWGEGAEWDALDSLWTKESGWCNTVANASSGAYGIAQALPPTKYPASAQASGSSSASAQISWGLAYIQQRYGDPIAAWAHEQSNDWY